MDRILLTGATGFIGQALLKAWQGNGEIAVLTQSGPRAVASLGLSPELIFDDADAAAAYQPNLVVHLAGAGIADARWTAKRRAALWASARTLLSCASCSAVSCWRSASASALISRIASSKALLPSPSASVTSGIRSRSAETMGT